MVKKYEKLEPYYKSQYNLYLKLYRMYFGLSCQFFVKDYLTKNGYEVLYGLDNIGCLEFPNIYDSEKHCFIHEVPSLEKYTTRRQNRFIAKKCQTMDGIAVKGTKLFLIEVKGISSNKKTISLTKNQKHLISCAKRLKIPFLIFLVNILEKGPDDINKVKYEISIIKNNGKIEQYVFCNNCNCLDCFRKNRKSLKKEL